MSQVTIIAFYKFVDLDNLESLQTFLIETCQSLGLKGSILLAHEGINGMLAGSRGAIDNFLVQLKQESRFSDIEHKESFHDAQPFNKLKVRLKPEIVNLGDISANPNIAVGKYVEPANWNDLINNPHVLLIDTRNDYEVELGTFKNAMNPNTASFTEFPDYVQSQLADAKYKKIAMFCTGGIRCEKATSYLLQQGYEEVYHLKGGILKYLEEVPQSESLWQGECFVFDDRISVDHDLQPTNKAFCPTCNRVIEMDGTCPACEASA